MPDKRVIPQNLVRLMSEDDRRKLGVRTNDEVAAENELSSEREVHSQLRSWLYRNEFKWFYHSDPVRRPTIMAGLPDFGIYRDSRILFIEIKIGKNDLSETQEKCFNQMSEDGNIILICHSLAHSIKAISQFFNLPT